MGLFSSTYKIRINGQDFLVVFGGWRGNSLKSIQSVKTGDDVTGSFVPFTKKDMLEKKIVSVSGTLFGSGQNFSSCKLEIMR